jgi:hypothetical protein
MEQLLLLLRHANHVRCLAISPRRPVLPFLHVSQRASIKTAFSWEEVPFTLTGGHLQVKPADTIVDRNCDEVRRQINHLIDYHEFTVIGFCQKIGVSKKSYYNFMWQNGAWKGQAGDTFPSALWYLQQREREGLELPTKKKPLPRKPRGDAKKAVKLEKVELDGEKEDQVPVFDTCSEIRRKVNVYLREPSNTESALLKALSSQFHHTKTRLTSSQLKLFRNARGPNVGNTNPVFYAAYVFFEKERIRLKKHKLKVRIEMEEIYGEVGGVNVKIPADKYGAWIGPQEEGVSVTLDRCGLANVLNPKTGGTAITYGPRGRPVPPGQEARLFVYD